MAEIQFFNSLGRRKEVFTPLIPGQVRMYSCGPTVYRYVHIGNLRSFLMADLIRRVLEYNGYQVTQIMNITDIGHLADESALGIEAGEDRVLAAARLERKTPQEIAEHYTQAFLADVAAINVQPAHCYPKASEHVPQMLALIQKLMEKRLAYARGGSVFFDVSAFPGYGKLSGHTLDELRAGYRIDVDEAKDDPADFALWRGAKPGQTLVWNSPWGPGYPGWHIECSAMSMEYLGPQLDIHTGGEDLIFPHHENEIAQSEGATGLPFVRYWMHGAHLLAEGRKMAKSTGNVLHLKDLAQEGIEPLAYRLLCLGVVYRSHMNVTWESLRAAQARLERLRRSVAEWKQAAEGRGTADDGRRRAEREKYASAFLAAINDDLSLPTALTVVWEVEKSDLPSQDKLALILDFDRVLGLRLAEVPPAAPVELTEEERVLIEQREAARKARDWATADRLRAELAARGLIIEDTPQGPRWRRG